jgi:hypothetical protein
MHGWRMIHRPRRLQDRFMFWNNNLRRLGFLQPLHKITNGHDPRSVTFDLMPETDLTSGQLTLNVGQRIGTTALTFPENEIS